MTDTILEPPVPHLITGLKMPRVLSSTLPGSAQLHVVPSDETQVTTLRIFWPGGSVDTPTPLHARIAASLVPEGSEHYPGSAIAKAVDHAGAKLALTAMPRCTALTLTALTRQMPDLLPVVADMVAHPQLKPELFERMRKITAMQYLTSLAEVDCRADILLQELLHGPGFTPARILSESEALNIPYAEVADFARSGLRCADKAIVTIAGGTPDSLVSAVSDMVASLPADGSAMHAEYKFEFLPPGQHTVQMPDASQCAVSMGMPIPPLSDHGTMALLHAITALGGYFGSRLMSNIREDKGYTYGIYANVFGTAERSFLQISAQCDRQYVDALIAETRSEMLRLATEPPVGDELHRLRQTIGLEIAAITDSPSATADALARELIGAVPPGHLSRRIAALDAISPESIAQAAAEHLRPDDLRIAIAGNY